MSMAIYYASNYSSIFLLKASITQKKKKKKFLKNKKKKEKRKKKRGTMYRMLHVIGGVNCMGVKERR